MRVGCRNESPSLRNRRVVRRVDRRRFWAYDTWLSYRSRQRTALAVAAALMAHRRAEVKQAVPPRGSRMRRSRASRCRVEVAPRRGGR